MIDRNRSTERHTGTSLGREVLDRIGGTLKEATGALVHDGSLRQEGELQRRKAEAARVARAEAFKAARRGEQAHVRVHGAERAAQRVRRMAEEEAEADHERIERRRQLDEAVVEVESSHQKAEAEAREATLVDAVDRAEALAAEERRRDIEEAHRAEAAALAARRRAATLTPRRR